MSVAFRLERLRDATLAILRANPAVHSLLEANYLMGTLSLSKLLIGVAKTKIAALCLDTAGVGLLAQANQLLLIGVTLASFAMGPALVQLLSRAIAQGDAKRQSQLIGTALATQCGLSVVVVLAGLASMPSLIDHVFGGGQSPALVLYTLSAIPFAAIVGGFCQGYLFSHTRDDLYVFASIAGTIIDLLIFTSLVYARGILGALAGNAIQFALTCGIFMIVIGRTSPAISPFRPRFHLATAREFVSISGLVFIVTLAAYATHLLIRSMVIQILGLTSNGIYQVAVSLTAAYSPFITNGLWTRLYPETCKLGDSHESRKNLHAAVCVSSLSAAAIAMALMIFPSQIIRIIYTESFAPAAGILPLQLAGDFFFISAQPFLAYMLGTANNKTYMMIWVTYFFCLFALSIRFATWFGLPGLSLAHLCSGMIILLLAAWRHSPISGLLDARPRASIVVLLGGAFTLVQAAVCSIGGSNASTLLAIALLVAFGFFALALQRFSVRSGIAA